jgi:N-acylneuraminate cytidylyltransferase
MDRVVKPAEVLAIIQARGGSKGLVGKNLRPLHGHPLIAYSVASALAASRITRVIMSTDDAQIAEVSRRYGAETPFMRPAELAVDDALDFPLFVHALQWLDKHEGYRPKAIVQLRPTTPLRPRGMLDEAVRLLLDDPQADCVRGVTTPKQNPFKMWKDGTDGYLAPLVPTDLVEQYNMPRQRLPRAHWQTGHVDVIRTGTITELHSLTGRKVRAIQIDPAYCVDIDTMTDLEDAGRLIAAQQVDIDVPQRPAGSHAENWPAGLGLLVLDFDGVMTDNRVLVREDGGEAVFCNRGDGMGLSFLRQRGIPVVVLSTETNPVVAARCLKLKIDCQQGLEDKASALATLAAARGVPLSQVTYVGNDVNDVGCMQAAGYAIAVADAHPAALAEADLVLKNSGGNGAVRELCDIILSHLFAKDTHA